MVCFGPSRTISQIFIWLYGRSHTALSLPSLTLPLTWLQKNANLAVSKITLFGKTKKKIHGVKTIGVSSFL